MLIRSINCFHSPSAAFVVLSTVLPSLQLVYENMVHEHEEQIENGESWAE